MYVKLTLMLHSKIKIEDNYQRCSLWLENRLPYEIGGFGQILIQEILNYEIFERIYQNPIAFFA